MKIPFGTMAITDKSKQLIKEIEALDKFTRDGILNLTDEAIAVTELGQQFVDVVCTQFDSYLKKS